MRSRRSEAERAWSALAKAAADGERQAFRRLYEAHVGSVHGQVGRMIGWGPENEDVVQEVFIQAFRSLPNFRGEAAFATWLFRLTHNVTVSHLRRGSSRPVELTGLKALSEAMTQPDFDARNQLRALYSALDQMPVDAREAFVLYEFEGLSLKDIAELTGHPLNTVAARVRRARERLRRLLGRESRAYRRAK